MKFNICHQQTGNNVEDASSNVRDHAKFVFPQAPRGETNIRQILIYDRPKPVIIYPKPYSHVCLSLRPTLMGKCWQIRPSSTIYLTYLLLQCRLSSSLVLNFVPTSSLIPTPWPLIICPQQRNHMSILKFKLADWVIYLIDSVIFSSDITEKALFCTFSPISFYHDP